MEPMASTEPGAAIRGMQPADWSKVRAIYAAGIASGNATFEIEPPPWEVWDEGHLPDLRFVVTDGEEVVGWAAASNVSDRCCYSGVAETSIYVHPGFVGRGIGSRLLPVLIDASERAGIWTMQAGIFPENAASLALHGACGFRVVGRRERLGKLDGQWRDVTLLERRVPLVL